MKKLVYAGALLSLLASHGAAQKLTGFTTSKSGDGVEVRILGEKLKQPRLFKFGPEKYVVEFDGAPSAGTGTLLWLATPRMLRELGG